MSKINFHKIIRANLILVLICFSPFYLIVCNAENTITPHLFAYKKNEILDYIKKANYFDFRIDEITRNSTGTSIYLHNFYRKDKNSLILSISASGGVKKLAPPSRRAYLNDEGEFVVWVDDAKNGLNFKNGEFRHLCPSSGYFGVESSGQFFFIGCTSGVKVINRETVQTGPLNSFTEVASTAAPHKILYSTDIRVENLFFKNDRLYLFARNYRNVKGPGEYEQHEIICQILKRTASKYELEEEIRIPRPSPRSSPFGVIDLDPWSNNVLVEDVRDMPLAFLTSWYLFDLNTRTMAKIGQSLDYGFFLREEILKNR